MCSSDLAPAILIGSFGLFFTLFLLFTRVLPVIAIAEVKSIMRTSGEMYRNKESHKSHTHGAEVKINTSHSPNQES